MSKVIKKETGKKLFRFQDLEIWKKAIEIGDKPLPTLPREERLIKNITNTVEILAPSSFYKL